MSGTNLRANVFPEVKKMSEQYKEMCSCLVCVKMKMYQESLNKYQRNILEQLKRAHDRSRRGFLGFIAI